MNSDIFKGRWHEFKGSVKSRWAKVTDDDLDYIAGRAEQLAGVLQKRYGYEREQAERETKSFMDSLN